MNNQLSQFIEELIKQKEFPDATPEVYNQLKHEVTEQLNVFIFTKIFEVLAEEDAQTLKNLLQDKNQHAVNQFTVDHVPNYTNFMASLLPEFRRRYLSL